MELITEREGTAEFYETCEQCDAPLGEGQRYCIECGTRTRNGSNPAMRYLSTRPRSRPVQSSGGTSARSSVPARLTTPVAVLIAGAAVLLVLVGMLLGRGGRDDSALVAAIKNQKPPVVNVSGGGTAAASGAASATKLPSDFTLDKGYTVKLETLPISGTDQAAATKAKQDAEAKGASDVGLINPDDFTLAPDQGSGNYVIYSGQFKKKADAQKALGKLKKRFSGAEVLAVKSASGRRGAVIAKTKAGTVHKASAYKATPKELKKNKKRIQDLSKSKGKDYLKKQKNMPNEVVVPPADGSTPATTTP